MIGQTFTWIPSEQTREKAPPVAAVQFGDGYVQRYALGPDGAVIYQADGVTPVVQGGAIPERHSLVFRKISELAAIEAFLAARRAVEWFHWTPFRGTQGRYVCRNWARPKQPGGQDQITASFERVYQ